MYSFRVSVHESTVLQLEIETSSICNHLMTLHVYMSGNCTRVDRTETDLKSVVNSSYANVFLSHTTTQFQLHGCTLNLCWWKMYGQETNIKFVKELEKQKVLYIYNLPGNSEKDIREKARQEVAAKVNMSGM